MLQGYVASTQWSIPWNKASLHLPCHSLYINLPPPHSFSTFLRNFTIRALLSPLPDKHTVHLVHPSSTPFYCSSSTSKQSSHSVQISYLLDFILSSSILDPLASSGLPSCVGDRCLVRRVINRLFAMGRATMKCSHLVKKTLTFQVKKGAHLPFLLPQEMRVWRWIGHKVFLVMVQTMLSPQSNLSQVLMDSGSSSCYPCGQ